MSRHRDRDLTPEEFLRIAEDMAKEIGRHPPGRVLPSMSDVIHGPKFRCVYFVLEDTNRLPGLDGAQTELVILRASVALLIEWSVGLDSPAPGPGDLLDEAERSDAA